MKRRTRGGYVEAEEGGDIEAAEESGDVEAEEGGDVEDEIDRRQLDPDVDIIRSNKEGKIALQGYMYTRQSNKQSSGIR